jgi:hypothetical protein
MPTNALSTSDSSLILLLFPRHTRLLDLLSDQQSYQDYVCWQASDSACTGMCVHALGPYSQIYGRRSRNGLLAKSVHCVSEPRLTRSPSSGAASQIAVLSLLTFGASTSDPAMGLYSGAAKISLLQERMVAPCCQQT